MTKYLLNFVVLTLFIITNLSANSDNSDKVCSNEMGSQHEPLGTIQTVSVPHFDENDFLIGYYYHLENGIVLLDTTPYGFENNGYFVSPWKAEEALFITAGSNILQNIMLSDVLPDRSLVVYNPTRNETRALYVMKEGYDPFDPFQKN